MKPYWQKMLSGRDYINELYMEAKSLNAKLSESSWAWLEGWVCGYTDSNKFLTDAMEDWEIREELLGYIKRLKKGGQNES